jgi:signal transduction histidine kinase
VALGATWTAHAQTHVLRQAQAEAVHDTGCVPTRAVALSHRWDRAFPGRDGTVRYSLLLPPSPADVPHGLYFPRVGNQVEVQVGGQVLARRGTLGDARVDAAKSPLWVTVPSSLLSGEESTPLEVVVTAQAGRWGGLAAPMFGPEAELYPVYQSRYVWRQWGAVAIVFSMALVAAISGGLWRLQRDAVYGYFALGAVLGVVRFADRLWEQPPLPWPLWGGVQATALALHVLFMARFALALVGVNGRIVQGSFVFFGVLEASAAMASFMFGRPSLWTAALALLALPSAGALAVVAQRAWTLRQREAIAVSLAGALVIVVGFRDFFVVRVSDDGAGVFSLLPLASMGFVLTMGWLIMERYVRQARQYQGLLVSLDQKVHEREQQLAASFAALQQAETQRATLQERQRIMRDIHDGVGAQLVGLLSLLKRGKTDSAQLQEHASAALDELRMAVDAMQPVNGDLATVLATLRYRLQPRLVAAGIAVDWQVEALPPMDHLTPQTVLQLQRILLEAFTNMLRHAQASRVRVSARHEAGAADQLVLELADNGIGMPDRAPVVAGHGLKNMQARATAIGATLRFDAPPHGGTRVTIVLPVNPAADQRNIQQAS